MLFGENAVTMWQALIVLLGGGGAGVAGKWLVDVWRQRRADRREDAEKTRTWAIEDETRTVAGWRDLAKQKDADIAQLRKDFNILNTDYTERMRRAEQRLDREVRRRYKCERRLGTAEVQIGNLEFAIDRLTPDGQRPPYRKYVPEPDDDDSELDDESQSDVRPHGPDGTHPGGPLPPEGPK